MTLRSRIGAVLAARSRGDAPGPIGLELDAEWLRLVQLERHAGELRVRARSADPIPPVADPSANLRPLVRQALAAGGFRGRRIVTAMPDGDVKLMVVNYQAQADRPEAERILGFVSERSGDAVEDSVVDYRMIRASEEGVHSALVAVARRDAVIDYLDLLRGAGLEVDALEIAPIAIHRLMALLGREAQQENELVLYCGRRRSHLIVASGRRLTLYREIDFGADTVNESVAKSLDMSTEAAAEMLHRFGAWPDEEGSEAWQDPAEALEVAETLRQILKPCTYGLAEEVKRADVYMASQWRGASLDRVSLLGSFSAWPRIDRLVESAIAIPTRLLDPLAGLPSRERMGAVAASGVAAEMSIAAGLSLRGMTGDE